MAFFEASNRRAKDRDMISAWLMILTLAGIALAVWLNWDTVYTALVDAFPFLKDILPM